MDKFPAPFDLRLAARKKVIRLFREGLSMEQIGRRSTLKIQEITPILAPLVKYERGQKTRESVLNLHSQGMLVTGIAHELSVTADWAGTIIRAERASVSPERIELEKRVVCMYGKGYVGTWICQKLGITRWMMYNILRKNKVRLIRSLGLVKQNGHRRLPESGH